MTPENKRIKEEINKEIKFSYNYNSALFQLTEMLLEVMDKKIEEALNKHE